MEVDSVFDGVDSSKENTAPRHERREPCAADRGHKEGPRRSEARNARQRRRVQDTAIQMPLRNAVRECGTSVLAQTADLSCTCFFQLCCYSPARRRFVSMWLCSPASQCWRNFLSRGLC